MQFSRLFFLVVVLTILSSIAVSAQSLELCLTRQDSSGLTPDNNLYACYDADFPIVTITASGLQSGDTVFFFYPLGGFVNTAAISYVNTTATVATISNGLTFTNLAVSNTIEISFTVELTGCDLVNGTSITEQFS